MTSKPKSIGGGELHLRRIALEMSQAQLAAALGLTARQIQRYEAGSPVPVAIDLATSWLMLTNGPKARAAYRAERRALRKRTAAQQ